MTVTSQSTVLYQLFNDRPSTVNDLCSENKPGCRLSRTQVEQKIKENMFFNVYHINYE